MKSKEIKAYNLPSTEKVLYRMETKPYFILGIFLTVGFVMIKVNYFLAFMIIATVVYAIIILPSKILLDFKKDYLVMYNRPSKTDCVIIYYDEIVSWTYKKDYREDEFIVELIDGSIEKVECYSKNRIVRFMDPNKEIKVSKK